MNDRRPDPYQQRARELCAAAGIDPEYKIPMPNKPGRTMPAWYNFKKDAEQEEIANIAHANAAPRKLGDLPHRVNIRAETSEDVENIDKVTMVMDQHNRLSEPSTHDPGGKVETTLPKGMIGDAEFYGDRQQYRLWLSRRWDGSEPTSPYILWNGMNPSTARDDVNDPTITREINFSKTWGYTRYFKTNVLDYRATEQSELRKPGVVPRSERNLDTILKFACCADIIILCHGVMHKNLQRYADETIEALRAAGYGKKLFCLGFTLLGHPRHPLYLKADTKPEQFI